MASVGKLGTGRRLALLLASMAGLLVLSGGMALAATVTCQVGVYCLGTKEAETIEGTANKDAIYARGGGDTVKALGESDYLYGQGGADELFGGPSDDHLVGGAGADTVYGGEGDDLISVVDRFTIDSVHCGPGEDTVTYDVLYLTNATYSDVVYPDCEHRLPRKTY